MKIIFFDGDCSICNAFVRFVMKHNNDIEFASQQSDYSKAFFEKYTYHTIHDTVVFFDNGKFYEKSTAALRILKYCGVYFKWMYCFILLPKKLRDWVYDMIARYRYRFNKKACTYDKEMGDKARKRILDGRIHSNTLII